MHTGPMGLDNQCSSSGISTAGAGVQVVRPQYADMGTSPFANTQDQEVTALINKLMQEMDEARAASSQISLERDEALARNECLTDCVDKVRRQCAGARPNELSSPDQRGSTLISQSANASTNVESLESVASEREKLRQEARDSEQRRATAQDTLDNVLLSNDESNARYQEELRQIRARYEESNVQDMQLMQRL